MQVEREMPNEDKEVAWNVGDGVCDHVGDNIYVSKSMFIPIGFTA